VEREKGLEPSTSSLEVTRLYSSSGRSKTPVGASDSALWECRGISTGAAMVELHWAPSMITPARSLENYAMAAIGQTAARRVKRQLGWSRPRIDRTRIATIAVARAEGSRRQGLHVRVGLA
jgi:hypothetical protein